MPSDSEKDKVSVRRKDGATGWKAERGRTGSNPQQKKTEFKAERSRTVFESRLMERLRTGFEGRHMEDAARIELTTLA